MGRRTINFGDIETIEPLGNGQYSVVIAEVVERQSQSSENPYLNFTLDVTEPGLEGRKLWFISSFSPKALFRMKELFATFGIDSDEVEIDVDDETGTLLEPQLVGLPAIAVVQQEMYDGRLRDRVVNLIGQESGSAPAAQPAAAAAPGRQSPFKPQQTQQRRTFK